MMDWYDSRSRIRYNMVNRPCHDYGNLKDLVGIVKNQLTRSHTQIDGYKPTRSDIAPVR